MPAFPPPTATIPEERKEPPAEKNPEDELPSKEEIVSSIEKVDMEIAKTEAELEQLKNLIFSKPEEEQREHGDTAPSTHTAPAPRPEKAIITEDDLVQSIYQANRERLVSVLEQYATLLIPEMRQEPARPLFTRLQDIPAYQENIQTHEKLRDNIVKVSGPRGPPGHLRGFSDDATLRRC